MAAPALVVGACGGSITGVDDTADSGAGGDKDGQATVDGNVLPQKDAATLDRNAPVDAATDAIVTCGNDAGVPEAGPCEEYHPAPCDLPEDAGWLSTAQCQAICGPSIPAACEARVVGGQRIVACMTCVVGRRPAGLGDDAGGQGEALGEFFAGVARLEAASIDAFYILRDELAAHGAPSSLLRRCERAARDEVRHAKITSKAARRFGAAPRKARVKRGPVRSLERIAIENAIEGCVRETFGALTGAWQAARAADPALRRMMRAIARDETRHAALSWAIAAWIEPRLSNEERARVDAARRDAVRALSDELAMEPPAALVREAGLPRPTEARAMHAALAASLWAA